MEGRLDFKAVFIGFIVDVVATSTFTGIITAVASGIAGFGAVRAGVAAGPAAGNAVVMQQQIMGQITTLMNSPIMIVAMILSGVLGSLIGGYVTGLMARGAETKNAAMMGAVGLLFTLIIFAMSAAAGNGGRINLGAGISMPAWVTAVSALLTIPAAVCGGALCSMRNTPAPREETFDQLPQ